MSQFAAPKNPPWARQQSAAADMIPVSVASPLTQVSQNTLMQQQTASNMMQQTPIATQTVYSIGSSNQGLQPPQYTAQQLSMGIQQQAALQQQGPPSIIPQPGIAIPTTLATTQQVAPVSYPNHRTVQQVPPPKQRVFTGTVTKLHDNFGFVDEDVFFQTTCVKGNIPKVGERVLVEATFNANMPFKWNATRIQLLPNQASANISAGKPNVMGQAMVPSLMGDNSAKPFSSRKGERFRDRERKGFSDIKKESRDRPDRALPPPKKRSRSRSPSKRGDRSGSPSRRRMRVVPRYVVQIPKLSFNLKTANVVTLKSRYSNMYVPSDFFKANFSWMEAFPLTRPFLLGHHCEFHVLHKDVESVNTSDALLDPPDADHSFNAKVMLLACPELEDLYHKSCSLSEDPIDVQENFVHPTRLIYFLVGTKGKNETMAIGGPWSPSQDGLKPDEDPKVLIKTAIRTTKALTGIDLSSCTQWYRFAEVRYLRPEETHKGKHLPTRVETTVIFFPDVWSCSPSRLEWATLQAAYKKQLQRKTAAITDGPKDTSSQADEDEDSEIVEVQDPTHFSQLDPKTLKIIDLRKELEARTLSSKGLKSQLIARLTKSLKMEQEKEESEEQGKEEAPAPIDEEVQKNLEEEKSEDKKKEEEEKKKKEEREKASLERKYALPENPAILVHPNTTAKSGKFDCAVMSLSVLLDYRPEDNKEHSFEISLFAEMFNEMLMRDFSFEIYKSLVRVPEKKEEEKKDKDKDKDKEKEKEKDKEKEKKSDDKTSKEPAPKKRRTDEKDAKDSKKDSDKNEKRAYLVKKDDDEKKEEDDEESEERKKKKDKKKYFSRFPALLLSFTYFDQNHTGYLIDKDVEEIIHTIGLQLSRAQVKKLVQKCTTRDSIHYRKLTDKSLPGQGVDKEEEDVAVIDTDKLALGNAEYDPDLKDSKSPGGTIEKGEGDVLTGMINYKGSVLDIESLLDRLEKSEKSRLDMEKEMQKLSKERDSVKLILEAKEETAQKLKEEVRQVKQKLSNQEKLTNFSESASRKYISALMLSKDHLTTMLDTVTAALEEKDLKKEDIIKKGEEKEKEKVIVKKEKSENGDV